MNFDSEQATRYSGHINLCEIDLPGQQAISRGKVLIAGAGGLGSPVALYLAAAGVGTVGIVDADTVSLSNLQRQIIHGTPDLGRPKTDSARDAMLRINPRVDIRLHPCFLTPENAAAIIGDYDITVDCTDNFDSRLLINDTCVALGKPFVFGSVSRFRGQLFTHLPGTADYRAIFGDTAPALQAPCSVNGVLNAVVGVVGAMQAVETLKYLASAGDLLVNTLLVFDTITMKFQKFSIK